MHVQDVVIYIYEISLTLKQQTAGVHALYRHPTVFCQYLVQVMNVNSLVSEYYYVIYFLLNLSWFTKSLSCCLFSSFGPPLTMILTFCQPFSPLLLALLVIPYSLHLFNRERESPRGQYVFQ